MKLGVNSVLFSGYDLKTAIEYIKFSGYYGIELAAIPGMVEHLSPATSDTELSEIRKQIEDAGLELYCIEAATDILVPENRERTKRIFEKAANLGIPIVTTGSAGESDNEEKTEASIRAVEELTQAAADVGIRYALKIHYGQSIYNTKTALRLMAEVKHPALGLNYDATHVGRVGEDPVAAIDALKEHIIHTHIRDTFIEQLKIAAPEYQIAGRGTVPLKEVTQKMVDIGYEGAAVLEIIGANDYELPKVAAIAAESHGYLSRLFHEAKEKKEELSW